MFQEPFPKGVLDRSQGGGIFEHPQGVLDQVRDEIAGVERRIAHGRKVEVDNPKARAIDENLVGIEIAVKEGGATGGEALRPSHAFLEDSQDGETPGGQPFGSLGQLDAEMIEFIRHGMMSCDAMTAAMQFEQSVGGAVAELRGFGMGKVLGQRGSRDPGVQDESEGGNGRDRVWNGDAVVRRRAEVVVGEMLKQGEIGGIDSAATELAEYRNGGRRPAVGDAIFDEATTAWLVSANLDASEAWRGKAEAIGDGREDEIGGCGRVEGVGEARQRGIFGDGGGNVRDGGTG